MEVSWLSAILVGAGYLAFGYFIGSHYPHRFFFSNRFSSLKEKDDSLLNHNNNSKQKKNSKSKIKDSLEVEQLAEILEDFKMILVVRNDLKMGKGKIAAQCSLLQKHPGIEIPHPCEGHATLGLYKKVLYRAPKALNRWEMSAQPKVVVKIESEEDMLALQERAKSLKLPTHITIDAGRTQIAPNSRTVMAILGPVEVVDEVTGGLKLL